MDFGIYVFTGGTAPDSAQAASLVRQFPPVRAVAADSGIAAFERYRAAFAGTSETPGAFSDAPDVLLGDFDSADPAAVARCPPGIIVRHPRDKDFTDTELALQSAHEFRLAAPGANTGGIGEHTGAESRSDANAETGARNPGNPVNPQNPQDSGMNKKLRGDAKSATGVRAEFSARAESGANPQNPGNPGNYPSNVDEPVQKIILIGAGGGDRIDHLLAVFDLFASPLRPDVWLCGSQALWFVPGGARAVVSGLDAEDAVSVLRTTEARTGGAFSSRGLVWEAPCFRGAGVPSLSNRIAPDVAARGGPVEISADGGAFVLAVPSTATVRILARAG